MRRTIVLTFIRLVPETPPAQLLNFFFPLSLRQEMWHARQLKHTRGWKSQLLLLKRSASISWVMHTTAVHSTRIRPLVVGPAITKAFVTRQKPAVCNWESELSCTPVGCHMCYLFVFFPSSRVHVNVHTVRKNRSNTDSSGDFYYLLPYTLLPTAQIEKCILKPEFQCFVWRHSSQSKRIVWVFVTEPGR